MGIVFLIHHARCCSPFCYHSGKTESVPTHNTHLFFFSKLSTNRHCSKLIDFSYSGSSVNSHDDWSFDRKTYTWSSRKSSHSWNPADFTMKSGGFHEIREIQQISPWNPADFTMKSDVSTKTLLILQGLGWISWNPPDFTWNPPDFIRISWNPPDFMWNRKTFARNCNSMFLIFDFL